MKSVFLLADNFAQIRSEIRLWLDSHKHFATGPDQNALGSVIINLNYVITIVSLWPARWEATRSLAFVFDLQIIVSYKSSSATNHRFKASVILAPANLPSSSCIIAGDQATSSPSPTPAARHLVWSSANALFVYGMPLQFKRPMVNNKVKCLCTGFSF